MAVQQNECYRLVTIGYLKSFIEQDGSKSIIQKGDGTYATITRTDDTYCPKYSELTGGTIIQVHSQSTTPKSDVDGIAVKSSAILGSGYADSQCVDRNDLYLSITRILPLSIKLGKYTFDACSGETNVSLSYSYIRTTKTMNGCATEESSIAYTMSSTTVDANCSELTLTKSLPNTASTINCTSYKMLPNNDGSVRSDTIKATVVFRGKTESSNTVTTSQPASEGGYSYVLSERDVPIDIRNLQASPSNYRVEYVSTNPPGCDINYPISLGGTGAYGHYVTYAYERCGVVNTADTIEVMVSTGTTTIPTVSNTLVGHTDDCCHGDTLVDTKTLTLSWSGLSVSRDFAAICQQCVCPDPPTPTKCCQLNGPISLNCNGEVQFEIGECGCKNMIDLGLSVKWGQYPVGTDENYNTFTYYIWGHTYEAHEGDTGSEQPQYEGDKSQCSSYRCETELDNAHDAIMALYSDSGYRMPTKAEAEELVNNCSAQHVDNYNGKGVSGWLLTSLINSNQLFLPEYGELYPPDSTHSTWWKRMNIPMTLWTRSGAWLTESNPVGHRLAYDGGTGPQGYPGPRMPANGGSRKYGCLIMPVCDRG